MRFAMALAAASLLAACSSTSQYEANEEERMILDDRYRDEPMTDETDFPGADEATYRGIAEARTESAEFLNGQMTMRVNFALDEFEGEIQNISNDLDDRYGGQLDLDGTIDKAAVGVNAQIDGNLTGTLNSPYAGPTLVLGSFGGEFRGSGAPALVIEGSGSVSNTLGVEDFEISGTAER